VRPRFIVLFRGFSMTLRNGALYAYRTNVARFLQDVRKADVCRSIQVGRGPVKSLISKTARKYLTAERTFFATG